MRPRKYPRHHQSATVRYQINGQFNQPQRKMQSRVRLKVFGYGFHTLANAIPYDKEQETAAPQYAVSASLNAISSTAGSTARTNSSSDLPSRLRRRFTWR